MKHSEGFLKLVDDAKSRINEVNVADTRDRMANNTAVKLIDVRETTSGMRRVPPGRFISARVLSNATSRRRCRQISGLVFLRRRLSLGAGGGVLQNMGYTNVWSMAGGWKAWKNQARRLNPDPDIIS
jgi:rhodanese-related sulfurtransferase